MKKMVILVIALLFGFWAQGFFVEGKTVSDAVILYSVGIAFFVAASRRPQEPPQSIKPLSARLTRLNIAIVAAGFLLVCLSLARFARNVSTNQGLILWLAGLALFFLGIARASFRSESGGTTQAVIESEARQSPPRELGIAPTPLPSSAEESRLAMTTGVSSLVGAERRHAQLAETRPEWLRLRISRKELIALGIILALAALMRLYRIDSIPSGLYLDEGDLGLTGLQLVESGVYTPFTRAATGHPTLFLYALGLASNLWGTSALTLRMVTIIVGLATIPAFYLLARQLFGLEASLMATALLAVSRWHVIFSRIAFEGILVPLFAILAFYFLIRALRSGRPLSFALAGLALGIGLSTYISFRIVPLIVIVFLAHRLVLQRGRADYRGLLIFFVTTLLVVGPLGVYFLKYPRDFIFRTQQAAVTLDIEREGSYDPLVDNVKKSLLMFNYQGDPRPRHNIPKAPELDSWTAIFFVLGLGYSVYRWRESQTALLIPWLLLGLLPGVLSLADSNPHSLRAITSIVAAYLLAGAFWDRAWAVFTTAFRGLGRRVMVGLCLLVLVSVAYANYDTYFNKQANNTSVYYDFDPAQTQVGEYIEAMGNDHLLYVSPALTNYSSVKYIPYGVPHENLDLNRHIPIRNQVDEDVIYVLELVHASLVPRLRELYPRGEFTEVKDDYGKTMYYTYRVPKEEVTAIQGLWGRYYEGTEATGQPVLERVDSSLSLQWTPSPVAPPFTAEWEGSLYVPLYGTYAFIVDSSGAAQLSIDGKGLVESRGGRAEASKLLPAGFHSIAVSCTEEEAGGWLRLSWITPGGREDAIPQNALYTQRVALFGLLGRYYPGAENWGGRPAVVQIDPYVAPNDVLHAPFSIGWEGKIFAPSTGRYLFATNSDDGSFLYINGQLVVDNGGRHGDRYVEGWIELEQGFHDIQIRYFQGDGGRKMELWWRPPGGGKEQVPAEQLIPPDAPLIEPQPIPTPVPRATVSRATDLPVAAALGDVQFLTQWGGRGSDEGLFNEPRGVAVDPGGYVYVADTGGKRVQKFDAQGGFVAAWLGGEGDFDAPFDLIVSSRGDVCVLDTARQAVLRFSSEGDFLGLIGADLGLYSPRGLGVDADDNLYVADTGGSRIVKLSLSGQFLAQYGAQGEGPGQLSQPTDVAVDGDGRLYVADTMNRRVQVLDSSGGFLAEWPIAGANTTDSPHIQLGSGGQVFLTDPEAHLVIVYDASGRVLAQWGGFGQQAGLFHKPIGLAADGEGRVYVTDTYNHRVQVFELGAPE